LPRSPHHRRPHRQQVLAVAASLWTVFLEFGKAIPQITLILTSALVLIIISVVLTKAFTERIITIEGILVPKLLSENGYTSDVASQRLRDAALKVAEKRNIPNLQMVLPNELPNIVVPAVGISINTLASFLQKLLFSDRRQGISGDLTVSNGQLWLHLRKDGQEFYVSEAGESIETPDKLLLTAAPYVLKETNPYLFAKSQYTYDKDPEKALETAKRTIERFPNSETALWCYVLEGVIYHDRKEYQNAEQAFTRAAELNPRYAYTYLNWGFLLYDQGRPDEAIANFRRAIALDARVAEGYNNLVLGSSRKKPAR